MENIVGDIYFRCKHNVLFLNCAKNWKDHQFTIKTFQIPKSCDSSRNLEVRRIAFKTGSSSWRNENAESGEVAFPMVRSS